MLNLAFRPTQSRTPTTTFSDHQFIHLLFRHMTLDALKSILFSICTFTIYLLVILIGVHVHIILQSTSFYWRDVVRQNGALKATLSKYLVDFDIFFQRRNDKETN